MKFQMLFAFLFIICISCGNPKQNKLSKDYLEAQDLIKTHKSDIFKIFENSTPEVKRKSAEFVNLCLNNTEEDFLKKSGKGKTYLRKVINNINFFVDKINEAKAFKPNSEQLELYNKFKGLLEEHREVVNKYINDRNPNFNQTDKQRIRMYSIILYNDFDGYRNNVLVTEREFEKNFRFLVTNWDDLAMQMYMHYGPELINENAKGSEASDLPF